jgi:hypothetical protein
MKHKINIIVVVGLVTILLCSGITYSSKVGYDGSQWWNWINNSDGQITTSNGKAYAATEAGLRSAVYSLNSTGGTVYIPAVTISCGSINISSNITIQGCGNKTVISNNVVYPAGIFNFDIKGTPSHWKDNIIIKDIAFTTSIAGRVPIRIDYGEGITLENILIYNTGANIFHDGVYVGAYEALSSIRARACTLRNVHVYGSDFFGIEFAGAEYCTAVDCIAAYNGQHGMVMSGAINCSFINCKSYSNTLSGFRTGEIKNCIFSDCIANKDGTYGFHIGKFSGLDSNNSIISSCMAIDNTLDGFLFEDANNITCSDLSAYGNGVNIFVDKPKAKDISINNQGKIINSLGIEYSVTQSGLQDAIYDLNSTNGGWVQLPAGTILLTRPIQIPSSVNIYGAGTSTRPLATNAVTYPITCLKVDAGWTATNYTLEIGNGHYQLYNVKLSNFMIDGNGSSSCYGGIRLRGVLQAELNGLFLDRFFGRKNNTKPVSVGINITGYTDPAPYYTTIQSCNIRRCVVGVQVSQYANDVHFYDDVITGGWTYSTTPKTEPVGVLVYTGSVVMYGCDIESWSDKNASGLKINGNTYGNMFFGTRFEGNTVDVNITSKASPSGSINKFIGCIFVTTPTPIIKDSRVIKSTFDNCYGYKTEEWGRTVFTAYSYSVNVTHNLSAAPHWVYLTVSSGLANRTIYADPLSYGATTFRINITGRYASNVYINWYAKV